MMGPEEESMETLTLASSAASTAASDYHSAISASQEIPRDPLLSPPVPPTFALSPSSSFVDPPSYSDVVFTPFNSSNGSVSPSPSSSTSNYLRITVSDPVPEPETVSTSLVPGSGSGSYFTYLITSRARDGTDSRVRRRFRDFVTLADRVAESHRGLFVPVRPDKGVIEGRVMKSEDFIEQRRVALERYLRRLAAHPVIGKSDELRVFLQAEGRLPLLPTTDVASRMLDGAVRLPRQLSGADMAGPEEVVQPAKGGRDLLRIFKELKQTVTNEWVGARPAVVEEDREFLEKKDMLQDLELQLTTTSQHAETLVKAQQDIGETMGELGLAFIKLTKFESDEATLDSQRTRAADMKKVATAAVKASRLYRELNAQTVKHLDTLHEHLGIMLSVHTAFSDRSSALLTVQTLMSDLSSLNSRVEKLEAAASKIFGGDRSRLRRVEELKETIRVTEDAKCCAVREYERIKDNNRSELESLDCQRRGDFLSMIKGFVISQVGYYEKIGSVWETVADEMHEYSRVKESNEQC
ncbi:sorting nexin 2B-like protein [Carex littledalei]|uniref:Sorting nexin 2B-like protein n=1 Tax=Carex littledalei TaxID=544730 RepID=A0A833R189_9POAL|nr:sorting nexin 2B-like protein [Carex littledalei]